MYIYILIGDMMLVRTFETLVMEVRKRLPNVALSIIGEKRGFDKLRDYIIQMESLYHSYQVIKRRGVNLWVR